MKFITLDSLLHLMKRGKVAQVSTTLFVSKSDEKWYELTRDGVRTYEDLNELIDTLN